MHTARVAGYLGLGVLAFGLVLGTMRAVTKGR